MTFTQFRATLLFGCEHTMPATVIYGRWWLNIAGMGEKAACGSNHAFFVPLN